MIIFLKLYPHTDSKETSWWEKGAFFSFYTKFGSKPTLTPLMELKYLVMPLFL